MKKLSSEDYIKAVEYLIVNDISDTSNVDTKGCSKQMKNNGTTVNEIRLCNEVILKHFPEIGYLDENGGVIIDDKSLTAIMFQVIQNQSAIIDDLNRRLQLLEAK
jgi:hypothetical protein